MTLERPESTTISGVADAHDTANHFATLKQKKMGMEEAVYRFNQKAKRGIEYLKKHKLIGDEPEDVVQVSCAELYLCCIALACVACMRTDARDAAVQFFRNSTGLDKSMLGEYLGEGDPFNIKVQ